MNKALLAVSVVLLIATSILIFRPVGPQSNGSADVVLKLPVIDAPTSATTGSAGPTAADLHTSEVIPDPEAKPPSLMAASDLFRFIEEHALKAYGGDTAAQLAVAEAIYICETALQVAPLSTHEPSAAVHSQFERCARLRRESPFRALPKPYSQYTQQYWLTRAHEAGDPVATAWLAMFDVANPAAGTEKIEAALSQAVRSGNPDVYYYVATSLSLADQFQHPEAKAVSARTAAWYLLACQESKQCTESPLVVLTNPCKVQEADTCDYEALMTQLMQEQLGSKGYAEANALATTLREHIKFGRWSDIDLSIKRQGAKQKG